jgi:protease II
MKKRVLEELGITVMMASAGGLFMFAILNHISKVGL